MNKILWDELEKVMRTFPIDVEYAAKLAAQLVEEKKNEKENSNE